MEKKKEAVWITGASSGIGKALCHLFVANGYNVIATARRIELLNRIKDSFGQSGKYFFPYQIDVSVKGDIEKFYNDVKESFDVEGLINNAGVTSFKKAADDSIEEIENIINTNLLGSIYCIKTVLADMSQRNSGTIVNILSVVTKKLFPLSSSYSASKAGLMAYTNVIREELRSKNIRVINVSPGATATDIWPSNALQKYSDRMMKAEDLAGIIFNAYINKSIAVQEEIVVRPILGDL